MYIGRKKLSAVGPFAQVPIAIDKVPGGGGGGGDWWWKRDGRAARLLSRQCACLQCGSPAALFYIISLSNASFCKKVSIFVWIHTISAIINKERTPFCFRSRVNSAVIQVCKLLVCSRRYYIVYALRKRERERESRVRRASILLSLPLSLLLSVEWASSPFFPPIQSNLGWERKRSSRERADPDVLGVDWLSRDVLFFWVRPNFAYISLAGINWLVSAAWVGTYVSYSFWTMRCLVILCSFCCRYIVLYLFGAVLEWQGRLCVCLVCVCVWVAKVAIGIGSRLCKWSQLY